MVWDAATGARLPLPEGDGREVRQLALSPDGSRLAASDVQAAPADRRPGRPRVGARTATGGSTSPHAGRGRPPSRADPGLPGQAPSRAGWPSTGTATYWAYGTVEVGLAAVATVATGAGERLAAFGDEPVDDVAFPRARRAAASAQPGRVDQRPSAACRTLAGARESLDAAAIAGLPGGSLAGGASRVVFIGTSTSVFDAATGEVLVDVKARVGRCNVGRERSGHPRRRGASAQCFPPGSTRMTEPNLLFGGTLSPDGSAAALLGQDAKLRKGRTGSEPPGIVDIACPE